MTPETVRELEALEAALREARAERDALKAELAVAYAQAAEDIRVGSLGEIRALAAEATLSAVRDLWREWRAGNARALRYPTHYGACPADSLLTASPCTCGLADLVRLLEQGDQSPVTDPRDWALCKHDILAKDCEPCRPATSGPETAEKEGGVTAPVPSELLSPEERAFLRAAIPDLIEDAYDITAGRIVRLLAERDSLAARLDTAREALRAATSEDTTAPGRTQEEYEACVDRHNAARERLVAALGEIRPPAPG